MQDASDERVEAAVSEAWRVGWHAGLRLSRWSPKLAVSCRLFRPSPFLAGNARWKAALL